MSVMTIKYTGQHMPRVHQCVGESSYLELRKGQVCIIGYTGEEMWIDDEKPKVLRAKDDKVLRQMLCFEQHEKIVFEHLNESGE